MKSPVKLPRDQVEALRPGDVKLYLSSRGWASQPSFQSRDALVFRHSSFPGTEILLPIRRELGDFVLRMADVVTTLAAVEHRSAWEVLNDLSGPSGDVFRLRVVAPDSTLGNLPLEEGIKLLQGEGPASSRRLQRSRAESTSPARNSETSARLHRRLPHGSN